VIFSSIAPIPPNAIRSEPPLEMVWTSGGFETWSTAGSQIDSASCNHPALELHPATSPPGLSIEGRHLKKIVYLLVDPTCWLHAVSANSAQSLGFESTYALSSTGMQLHMLP